MKFHPRLAPIKAAVFPLVKKDGMPEVAQEIYRALEAALQRLLRREGRGRPPLSPPGRSRHAVLHHRRRPDARATAPSRSATATRSSSGACKPTSASRRLRGSSTSAARRRLMADSRAVERTRENIHETRPGPSLVRSMRRSKRTSKTTPPAPVGDRALGRQARHVSRNALARRTSRACWTTSNRRSGGQLSGRAAHQPGRLSPRALGRLWPTAGDLPRVGSRHAGRGGRHRGSARRRDLARTSPGLAGTRRPDRRASRASAWRSNFRPEPLWPTTWKRPRRWWPRSAARTWASAWTCFTTTSARASSKTWRYLTRETCSTCSSAICPACRASWPPTPTASCRATATFNCEPIVAQLRQIGYDGYVSVELMNPQIWRIPPRQFGEIAMTALAQDTWPGQHGLMARCDP